MDLSGSDWSLLTLSMRAEPVTITEIEQFELVWRMVSFIDVSPQFFLPTAEGGYLQTDYGCDNQLD